MEPSMKTVSYIEVQQLRKQAANDFWNFGAGRLANEELGRWDNEYLDTRKVLEGVAEHNPDVDLTIYDTAVRNARAKTVKDVAPIVHDANLEGAILGGMAGLAGGGLTYAGLGLIPQLKKRKGLRLLAGIMAGLPLGIYTADRAAYYQA